MVNVPKWYVPKWYSTYKYRSGPDLKFVKKPAPKWYVPKWSCTELALHEYWYSSRLTETHTDTEMIDISKTHTESNTEKIFNIDTHIEMIA